MITLFRGFVATLLIGAVVSAGNVAFPVLQNVYDFENYLVQHGNLTIIYDGDGNRVQKTAAGVTTSYLVDTNNLTGYAQVVEELQNAAVVRAYTYGLDLISQRQLILSAWNYSCYGYDGHGSVRQLIDSLGTVTDSYDYDRLRQPDLLIWNYSKQLPFRR